MRRVNHLTEHMREQVGPEYTVERCSGRTTSLALKSLARAIDNPGQWIKPQDHYGTTAANLAVVRVVQALVDSLDLKLFEFKYDRFRSNHITEENN